MPPNDDLLRVAIDSFQAGQLESAERQFRELLAQDGKHLAGLNLLGMVLTAAGKFDEAEPTIKAALAINSHSDASHYNLGIVLKALKRPAEALASFDRAIAINPAVADSWVNRGAVLNTLGRHEEAIAAFGKALALKPDHVGALTNTGNVLAAQGRHDDAIGYYDKALAIDERSAEAWNGRGVSCNILKRHQEAADAFNRAAGLKPDFVEAWIGLGGILSLAKDSEKALTAYDKALALTADSPAAWLGRALSLAQMKRKPEAIAAYRDAIAHGVDAGQVALHLAALGAEPPPAVTPPGNVVAIFDQYADTFDRNLVDDLKYRIPAAVADVLRRHATTGGLDILDLGCGTGLTGEQIASLKRTMTGVDLSPKMLEKARQRGVYDQLFCAELMQFLDTQEATCDVVISTDVFIYIGDLAPVFQSVRSALRNNGLFCFSIEASPDDDVVFRESFHFAHSAAYIRRLAQQHGFSIEELEAVVIRQDGESPIDGYLAVLRCAG
jgi:predicted TPR repeat methyltransferase